MTSINVFSVFSFTLTISYKFRFYVAYCSNILFKKSRSGEMTQMVECLPSKLKVLSSNPNNAKKKKKEIKMFKNVE
jgi:hypothetical protein